MRWPFSRTTILGAGLLAVLATAGSFLYFRAHRSSSPIDIIKINPGASGETFDIGLLPPVFAGQILNKSVLIRNAASAPLDLQVRSSCAGCTRVEARPNHLLPGERGEITITYDTDGPLPDQPRTIPFTVFVTAKPEGGGEYAFAVTGKVVSERSVFVQRQVSFGRQPRGTPSPKRTIAVTNYSHFPASLSFDGAVPATFRLDCGDKMTVPADSSKTIGVFLASEWNGRETQAVLPCNIVIGQTSWKKDILIVAYPLLEYHADPEVLFLGALKPGEAQVMRTFRVLDSKGKPAGILAPPIYDDKVMSVEPRGEGVFEVTIRSDQWREVTKREILIRCGTDSDPQDLRIPVIAVNVPD